MDARGQSEMLGSLLMVAVVVVLITTVSAVYLSLAQPEPSGPRTDFDADVTPTNVTITHVVGEGVRVDEVDVVVRSGPNATRYGLTAENLTGDGDDRFELGERWRRGHGLSLAAGDRVTVLVVHAPTNTRLYEGTRVV